MYASSLSDFSDTFSESSIMSEVSSPLLCAQSPLPRSRYYFDDVIAEFLVEGCLFKVHRYYLDRESPIFPREVDQDGVIKLEGVKKIEFESLLDFFYGRKTEETSLAAWTSILSISTRFRMSFIRSEAISAITNSHQPIDPIDQIVLAVTHDVPDWLPVAYTALCYREKFIADEEGVRLGVKTALRIAEAREKLRDMKLKRLGVKVDFDVEDVKSTVNSIFWPEEAAALTPEDEDEELSVEDADYDDEERSLRPQPSSSFSNPDFGNFPSFEDSMEVNPINIGRGREGDMGGRDREAARLSLSIEIRRGGGTADSGYSIVATPRGGRRSSGGQTSPREWWAHP